MKKYHLYRETLLPTSIENAFDFFSNPYNLQEITPDDMDFKVLNTDLPLKIKEGLKIDYIVKPLLGIPLKWQTLILNVKEPYFFVDEQIKGPYAYWHHEHRFIKQGELTLMIDDLTYCMPLGILGRMAHLIVVKSKLNHIFNYRTEKILSLFISE
jgi:ligand-binding SRPBCC domain-containing protein